MWRKSILALAAAGFLAWGTAPSRADVILDLEPEVGVNLANLALGQSFRINVVLSGVNPGEVLEVLTASVLFDGAVFGTPTDIAPGPIVPEVGDFLSFADLGQADGALLASVLPANGISDNGVFYSFEVTVQAQGSGSFALDALATSAQRYNQDNPEEPLEVGSSNGDPLAYVAVPSPATAGIMGVFLLASAIRRRGRATS